MATFSVRIHGRGGQGVVTAAELLSVAAFLDGKQAQAFPSFGSERTGAPIVSFCRIDDKPIRTREPIDEPDAVIVQDPTLLHTVDVFSGLQAGGYVVVNSSHDVNELGLADLLERHGRDHVITIAATEIAREHIGRPLPGAVLLGALAALTQVISASGLEAAIRQRFDGKVAQRNVDGATAAFDVVLRQRKGLASAAAD